MAIKTNTELKQEIATNKLQSQLLINMVDSLGHPQDSNGNDILTQHTNLGNIFDSSKWGSALYSLDIGSTGTIYIDTSGNKYTAMNLYNDGSIPKFKTTGFATLKEEILATGLVVEYVSSASGSADGTVTLVETKKTDADGNVAYNGATIPVSLNEFYKYTFYTNGKVEMHREDDGDKASYTSSNIYFNGSSLWTLIDSLSDGWIEFFSSNTSKRSFVPNGTSDGNFIVAPFLIYEQSSNGNVNIKTGGTYTSTL